jgi:peptide-methionine (R)-S-oxide reductase
MTDRVRHSDAEWRDILSPEEYRVLRERGTEPPFTGVYVDNHDDGLYRCAACGSPLFRSSEKYDSGSGWPSFWRPVSEEAVDEELDTSHGMVRTEITCAACGSHLGHKFPDGPQPTGERYCINSVSLDFDNG